MSFVAKLAKNGSIPIYFITFKALDGRDCYHFIITSHEKMKLFSRINEGSFDLKEFGEIIVSGFGLQPSNDNIQLLKEKYGFEFK